jgi:hypothetical protein
MTLHALAVDRVKPRSLNAFRLVPRLMLVGNHPIVPYSFSTAGRLCSSISEHDARVRSLPRYYISHYSTTCLNKVAANLPS